jgi:hypothetical protein
MAELVVFPGPDGGLLALSPDDLRVARLRAQETWGSYVGLSAPGPANGKAPAAPEPLLDDQAMEVATGVAASWWANAARRDEVPHYRIGRWVRFRLSEVIGHGPRQGRRVIGHAHQESAAPSRKRRKTASKKPATALLHVRSTPKVGPT